MSRPKILAFYLPQYYPTPTNDRWYGTGFTEWTNVGKARPLFRGHYQPHVPADLGYYDLRNVETQRKQSELAKEAGIDGFVYYHYWFGDGDMELDIPLQHLIADRDNDFPFCVCWANQSWYSKFWNHDAACEAKLVKEQKYDDEAGIEAHFKYLLSAFQDDRYIHVDGRPVFMIYRPAEYPSVGTFIEKWNELGRKYLGKEFYFIGQAIGTDEDAARCKAIGMDGVNIARLGEYTHHFPYNSSVLKYYHKFLRLLGKAPYHYKYMNVSKWFVDENGIEARDGFFPTLIPNWDHSPRSGKRGAVFHDALPEYFKAHAVKCLKTVRNKDASTNIVFLKSWNEWGEGNHMEPDLKYGKGYIKALRDAISEVFGS